MSKLKKDFSAESSVNFNLLHSLKIEIIKNNPTISGVCIEKHLDVKKNKLKKSFQLGFYLKR